ncbi:MAG TPA: hypothetical protein VEW93_07865 [Acidimicrobiales bacterium]|nr:hypothetical protein [Acidimicrobiales bacterium]
MSDQQTPAHALLGVYAPDRVPDLRRRLAHVGVRDQEIRTDAGQDERTSLRAEMREEATESMVMPQAGILYSKEATKATSLLGPILTAIGVVVALPVAVLLPDDIPLWLRLLICALCGGAVGGTIAVIVLPAMAVKNQDVPSAAQRGQVVRVSRWAPEVEAVMVEAEPLRLDRLGADGEPIGPVITEEASSEGGIAEELGRNFARERDVEPRRRSR